MLQESARSKGPRLPTSIQSTPDSIKNEDTTLMRINPQGRIHEFSDLGCPGLRSQISDARVTGVRDGLCQGGGFGFISPDSSLVQGPRRWGRGIRACHDGPVLPVMAWPWSHHPGYTLPPHVALAVADTVHMPDKRVLWAQIEQCVTLKRGLKSV